jgi:SAM-dependent methyltransferase
MITDNFYCPDDLGRLTSKDDSLECVNCGAKYVVQDGIPVFAEKRGYWSNVPQDTMRRVIELSDSSGDWRTVLKDQIPACERHISPLFRGDIHAVLPISQDSIVLDAGSMWGGITLPLARFCHTIYAVDQTWESLKYLEVRAKQESLNNIIPVESSIAKLPFESAKFDLVILNGVLEWLATDEDVVLERDWDNASTKVLSKIKGVNPELMQLAGLKELNRVLKDDGSIYIAIENRIGLQYLAGYPDDHVNIRFVSFLPRFLADFITRKVKNHPYRTYLYSPNKLKKLLKRAGFRHVELYSSYPHYNIISRLTPFADFDSLGNLPLSGGAPLDTSGKIKVALFALVWGLVPNPIRKHLAPSISVIAGKNKSPIAEMVNIFLSKNIINHANYSVILANNRFSDETPANFLLKNKDEKSPEFFCKLTRDRRTESLVHENSQLVKLNEQLKDTSLSGSVPRVRFTGDINGMELQVADFEDLIPGESGFLKGALRALIGDKYKSGLRGQVRKLIERRWRATTSRTIDDAMVWLSEFNKNTSSLTIKDTDSLVKMIGADLDSLSGDQLVLAKLFLQSLSDVNIGTVQLAGEHGDFDLCNVFRKKNKSIFLVDFEHMEEKCLPFFDIGNILFSSVVREWKDSGRSASLETFFTNRGWDDVLKKCLKTYAKESGVSLEILEYLPGLVAIRQFTKIFPESRDPKDYPLYDIDVYSQMISWKLELLDGK